MVEFQNQLNERKNPEHIAVDPDKQKLINKIYFNKSQGLLPILLKRSLKVINEPFTLNEMRLVARAFASMPANEFIEQNYQVFDSQTIESNKMRPDEETKEVSSKFMIKTTSSEERISLMAYFNALANIIKKYEDPQARYFALYSVYNFIYAVSPRKVETNLG